MTKKSLVLVCISFAILFIGVYTLFNGFPLFRMYANYEAKNYIESKYGLEFHTGNVHYNFDKPKDDSGFSVLLDIDENELMYAELDSSLYRYKTHVQVNTRKLGDRTSYYDNLMEGVWLNQIGNELYPSLEGVSSSMISIVSVGLYFEGKIGNDLTVIEDHHFEKYKDSQQFHLIISIEERLNECIDINKKLGNLFAKIIENEYRVDEIIVRFGNPKVERDRIVFSYDDYQKYDEESNIYNYLD